jgi:hypothetical protein
MTSNSSLRARNLQVQRRFVPSRFQSMSLAQAFEHALPVARRRLFKISENTSSGSTCDIVATRSVLSGGASL